MKPTIGATLVLVYCVASLFLSMTCACAPLSAADSASADGLAELCRGARQRFRPLRRADLAEVKAELLEAVARLDRRLDAAGENGSDWRKYLQWGEMIDELNRSEEPDLQVLDTNYKKYTARHDGLRLVWFLEVRRALRRYRNTARNIDNPKLQPAYEQLLDVLAERLQAHAAEPTSEQALVIGHAVGQLEEARQANELVREIRRHLMRPNLLIEVSAETINASLGGPVEETGPVSDYILGTTIRGTGHTLGQTTARLIPDSRRAAIDLRFCGAIKSDTLGYHGSLTIFSKGQSEVESSKRIYLNATGFSSVPTESHVTTKTRTTGIRSRRGCRLVEKMAWKRAGKQKAQAECIASRHAEQRADKRIDRESGGTLARAEKAFQDKFRMPFLENGLFPQLLQFSTTENALHVVSLRAEPSQLAASTEPTELVERRDMALRVHESMINNLAHSALSGILLREKQFQQIMIDLVGVLPERLRSEEGQDPWAIHFARQRPLWVEFAGGRLEVTIRGRSFHKGDDRYPGMDITAEYKIVRTELGYKAIRQGEVRVFPPDYEPGSGKALSTRQVIIRTLLQRRFDKIFQQEFIGEGFTPPGALEKAGKMMPVQFTSKDGWIAMAWKQAADEQVADR